MVNLKLLTVEIVGMFVVFALALFLPAGTVVWPAGWAFLVLFFGFTVALSRWLLRHNPLARVVVWGDFGADPRRRHSSSSTAGGAHAASRTARILGVYGQGEVSLHPVCLVMVLRRNQPDVSHNASN